MDSNYFTPKIEDIHIGYECEIYAQCTSKMIRNVAWHTVSVGFHQNHGVSIGINQCKKLINSHHLRVPYLTKEQIEAEGWIYKSTYDMSKCMQFDKGNYMMGWYYEEQKLGILVRDPSLVEDYYDEPTYRGECKDINTFRTICKLLKL